MKSILKNTILLAICLVLAFALRDTTSKALVFIIGIWFAYAPFLFVVSNQIVEIRREDEE